MKNFSLLLPIRRYPLTLQMMMKTVAETTRKPSRIEIRFVVDDDDEIGKETTRLIKRTYKEFAIFIHIRPRGNSLVDQYYNWLVRNFANAKYYVICNHDGFFRSKDWDINCFNKLEEYLKDKPDRIVFGLTEDCETNKKPTDHTFTCFPIFSREVMGALNFIVDPRFLRWGADGDIARLYADAGRLLDLRSICKIEHRPKESHHIEGELSGAIKLCHWKDSSFFKEWYIAKKIKDIGDYKEERLLKLKTHINKYYNEDRKPYKI